VADLDDVFPIAAQQHLSTLGTLHRVIPAAGLFAWFARMDCPVEDKAPLWPWKPSLVRLREERQHAIWSKGAQVFNFSPVAQ